MASYRNCQKYQQQDANRYYKEQILEGQKKFTGSEKDGGKIMGINQFLDTEFLLPHTPSINIVCNSPFAPLVSPNYHLFSDYKVEQHLAYRLKYRTNSSAGRTDQYPDGWLGDFMVSGVQILENNVH